MRLAASICIATVWCASPATAQTPPTLPETDGVRIAEAFRLADAVGNRIWPGWDQAPFAVLLVTADHEFLVRHPRPSDDFTALANTMLGGQKVFYRPRTFDPQLLATFPAVGGVPTVVVGQAERTSAKTSTRWVLTLLHEHFHQLQYSQPGYYAGVDALGLAKGDQTGMWMLNYEFPYEKTDVAQQFAVMSAALSQALEALGTDDFDHQVASYLAAKEKFRALLSADDYTYFAFQTWQEGIARYTECRVAGLAAADYQPSAEFQALPDFSPFLEVADDILSGIGEDLKSAQLAKDKRVAFYALGAAEGFLLELTNPTWRERYFADEFALDGLLSTKK